MDQALREARKAVDADEVPVGAVIVDIASGRIVARAHNQRELLQDPTAHAEMIAITQAAAHYGSWRLTEAALFVTLEPCVMCAGAIVLARLPRVYYGTDDPKAGAHRSVFEVLVHERHNHRPEVVAGVRAPECAVLLRDFFQKKRQESRGDHPLGGNRPLGGNGRIPDPNAS
jgi:tRNA(adenine34) deaminase